MIGISNDEINFPHKLLLTGTVSKIRKAFANGSSANIKFLKTQLPKMIQSEGILGELLVAIMLENLAGCRTMFIFAISCKIGALERNAYLFHV